MAIVSRFIETPTLASTSVRQLSGLQPRLSSSQLRLWLERTYPLLKQLIHLFHDLMDIGFRSAEVGDAGTQDRSLVDEGLGHPGDLPPVQRGEKGSRVEMLTRKADQRQWRFVDQLPARGRQRPAQDI